MSDSLIPDNNASTEAPTWYVDEGVPGPGNRPEWLNPKFKTVAEVARSYNELEKKFGAMSGAPDDYDFGEAGIDKNNPHMKDLVNYAKEQRISQDAFSQFVKGFAGYADSSLPNPDEELKRLGPDGEKRIKEISQWAANNLSETSNKTLYDIATKAEVVEMLDEIRQKGFKPSAQPPQGYNDSGSSAPTEKEVRAELSQNLKRYNSDPNYRNEIRSKLERALKS